MAELTEFKSGKDLGEETQHDDEETVTCVDCGAVETATRAYQDGWQLEPSVCPGCLRWAYVGGETCCGGGPM